MAFELILSSYSLAWSLDNVLSFRMLLKMKALECDWHFRSDDERGPLRILNEVETFSVVNVKMSGQDTL